MCVSVNVGESDWTETGLNVLSIGRDDARSSEQRKERLEKLLRREEEEKKRKRKRKQRGKRSQFNKAY